MPTRMAIGVPTALAVARLRAAKLRRLGPAVIGLALAQRHEPMMLSAEGWHGGTLTDITLSYGRVLDPDAPLIELTTYFDREQLFPLGAEIARYERQDTAILNRDWERVSGSTRYEDESAAARMDIAGSDLEVFVSGAPQSARAASDRHYQAIGFRYGDWAVRAVSRHPRGGSPRFEVVTDLEPYFHGLTQFILSLLTWTPAARSR